MRFAGRFALSAVVAAAFLLAPAGPGESLSAGPNARTGRAGHRALHRARTHSCLVLESRNDFRVLTDAPSSLRTSPEFQSACAVLRQKARWLPERDLHELADRICRLSRAKGIEAELLLAIIQTESNFRPTVTSPAGAVGLMQLLPSTARSVARELRIDWRGDSTLHDPLTNLELGTHYFHQLLRRYDGNSNLALLAYNMGPSRVDASLQSGLPLPQTYPRKVEHYRERLRSTFDRRADRGSIPR